MKIGDYIKVEGKDVDPIFHEIAIMKQLIRERSHPLDLLRELISNAGAKEVGATEIKIRYSVHEDYGHVFEVIDNGCGMNFSGNNLIPGRLDRFLGLGLSAIVGLKSDEFSWKGLGSKLSFQSRKVEVETWTGNGKMLRAEVNEPWYTIENGRKPKPKIFELDPPKDSTTGTIIKVFGHPPHRKEKPFSGEEIKDFLYHRTYFGFTRKRENSPRIVLSVFGQIEELDFGFPEIKNISPSEGTVLVKEFYIDKKLSGTNKNLRVGIHGFYTLDEKVFGLKDIHYNNGLILSVQGIPYLKLDLEKYGSRQLFVNPGDSKCCLILECDGIQEEMNISRSGLVDSAMTELFKQIVSEILAKIESAPEHLSFRKIPETRKHKKSAHVLSEKKRQLESSDQNWVVIENIKDKNLEVLGREPDNENDILIILSKLEALNLLPFSIYKTLGHTGKGPDIIAHFQEDDRSDIERYITIEIENKFASYRAHGHLPSQYPKVICWDLGKTPKVKIEHTNKKYKFVVRLEDKLLHIYTIRRMDQIRLLTSEELRKKGINI